MDLLFRCNYLHDYIHRISSRHSTSGAVKDYARALYEFADEAIKNRLNRTKTRTQAIINEEVSDILRLLHRTQQAYPGFDIHQTCLRLCELDNSKSKATKVLKAIHGDPSFKLGTQPDDIDAQLDALKSIVDTVDRVITEGREEITTKFLKKWDIWANTTRMNSRQLLILTHGYSKTVRNALESIFQNESIHNSIRVLVMSSSEEDIEDSHRMVYELRSHIQPDRRQLIAEGDEDVLLGLMDPQSDLLIVIGAECFDDSKRIIHPRGALKKLEKLCGLVQKPEVWVLAENYKRQDDNLIDILHFFRYHLDRLDIYPSKLITEVIPS